MRYLLAILILVLLCSLAFGERVKVLPQDADKQYITVFGNGPVFDALVESFNTDLDLKSLRGRSHFNVINSDSVMFKQRYAEHFPELPIVCIQSADGRVLYESAILDDLKVYAAPTTPVGYVVVHSEDWCAACVKTKSDIAALPVKVVYKDSKGVPQIPYYRVYDSEGKHLKDATNLKDLTLVLQELKWLESVD